MFQKITLECDAFRRRRAKIRDAVDSGQNSNYLHASASHRLWKNKIASITYENQQLFSHEQNFVVLFDHFWGIIGVSKITPPNVDLTSLYTPQPPDLAAHDLHFSGQEVKDAFFQMNPIVLMALDLPSMQNTGTPSNTLSFFSLTTSITPLPTRNILTVPSWLSCQKKMTLAHQTHTDLSRSRIAQ